MARLDDALNGITEVIVAALADNPLETAAYPGWPHPEELKFDLQNFKSHISVYPMSPTETLGHTPLSSSITLPPTIDLEVEASATQLQGGDGSTPASGTITFTGDVGTGLNLLVKIDTVYVAYHPEHPPAPEDPLTVDDIAAEYADAINNNPDAADIVVATAAGNVLTLTHVTPGAEGNAIEFWSRVGGTGSVVMQVKKHELVVQVHVWSYDHETRMLLSEAIQSALDANAFLEAPDTSPVRLTFSKVAMADNEIPLGIYRRILHYDVEYTTTLSAEAYTVLEGLVTVTPES